MEFVKFQFADVKFKKTKERTEQAEQQRWECENRA